MLGRLVRWLRAMGYDTLYPGQCADRELLRIAQAEERLLVTRDRMLARLAHPRACLIQAERVDDQILEAVALLALAPIEAQWLSLPRMQCPTRGPGQDRAFGPRARARAGDAERVHGLPGVRPHLLGRQPRRPDAGAALPAARTRRAVPLTRPQRLSTARHGAPSIPRTGSGRHTSSYTPGATRLRSSPSRITTPAPSKWRWTGWPGEWNASMER